MGRIGIYLGSKTDSPENIEEVLRAWGRYLSGHTVDTFGSVSLPHEVESLFNHVELPNYRFYTPLGKIITAYRHCTEYVDKCTPDVLIQIWTYSSHAPGVVLAGVQNNLPTVVRFTGDLFKEYKGYQTPSKWAIWALNNGVGRFPLRFADKVITLGPYSKQIVLQYGADLGSVITIPPPRPDKESFHSVTDNEIHRKQLNLPSESSVVLYVGRLSKQKGMPFLIDVIESVHSENDTTFLIVGEGPYRTKLKRQFSDDTVITVGHIPHDEIDAFYKAADVYIHPSKFEGLPLVILESLACDTPVIARDAGDISFVTTNIVHSSNEMAKFLQHKDWSKTWKNAQYFSPDYQQQVLTNVLNDLMR